MATWYEFRWVEWNVGKVDKHGLTAAQAEHVVNRARFPYPRYMGNGKHLVAGVTEGGLWIEVIYLIDPPREDDDDVVVFVIHARPLDADEAARVRRHVATRSFK